jgi:hypothetical protein
MDVAVEEAGQDRTAIRIDHALARAARVATWPGVADHAVRSYMDDGAVDRRGTSAVDQPGSLNAQPPVLSWSTR